MPEQRAYKVITIDDFSGGLNSWENQAVIAPNHCASGSLNVWAPQHALTKTPGTSLWQSVTGGTDTGQIKNSAQGINLFYVDPSITTAFQLYFLADVSTPGINGSTLFSADGVCATALGYVTGTCSISGASLISATGSGTSWLTQVSTGDLFSVSATAANTTRTWGAVKSIEDNTHLTLTAAYVGVVPTGTNFVIQQVLTAGAGRGPFTAATLNGMIAFSNTVNTMMTYDSTGTLRQTAGPKAQYLATFKNYMFGLRTTTAESRLYWSTVKDPTSWPSNNFIDIDKFNGKGTGLYPFGNELLVFKTRALYRVLGEVFDPTNPTYSVIPIETPDDFVFNDNGNVASHTILYFGQPRSILLIQGRGTVYSYAQGSSIIQKISQLYQPDLSTYFSTTVVPIDATGANLNDAHAISFNNNVFLSGIQLASGTDLRTGILDRNGSFWATNTTASAGASFGGVLGACHFGVLTESTARPSLLYADTQNGYAHIYKWDMLGPTYATNYAQALAGSTTTQIDSVWLSKEFDIDYGFFRKFIIYLAKQSAGNLTVSWSIDQAAYVDNTVDMTLGRGQIIRKVLDINQKGTSIQIKITHKTASQTFQVYGIKIYYEPIDENRQV